LRSLGIRCGIAAAIAAESLRIRWGITVQSLRNRCGIAAQSLHYRCTITAQSLYNRCGIAAESLCNPFGCSFFSLCFACWVQRRESSAFAALPLFLIFLFCYALCNSALISIFRSTADVNAQILIYRRYGDRSAVVDEASFEESHYIR
jgi:hypothetical protein